MDYWSTRLTILLMLLSVTAFAQPGKFGVNPNLRYGLVGWWPCNEGSGTVTMDWGGLANNGTLLGSPLPVWTNGIVGSALYYNGSTARLNVGVLPQLSTGQSFTAWVIPWGFTAAYASVMSRYELNITNTFTILVKSNGKLALYLTTSTSATVDYDGTGANTLSAGKVYFLALTYNSTAGLVGYVNGAVDGTAAASGVLGTGSQTNWVGAHPSITGRYFQGVIDDPRIYNRALSAAEVKQLYGGGYGSQ